MHNLHVCVCVCVCVCVVCMNTAIIMWRVHERIVCERSQCVDDMTAWTFGGVTTTSLIRLTGGEWC